MPAIDPKAAHFICALCKGEFEKERKDWSFEHAVKELETKFPGQSVADCVEVCDGCWKRMGLDD